MSLVVRAPGYVERTLDVEPGGAGVLEIALVSRGAFREQVDVRAIAEPATDAAGASSVRPNEVMEVAGGAENVFRVLQTLPGVASPEDFSSRISVRGGGPDENLTVMDGVEIHNPYRLFGLVSAFNPETVDSFELTAGGFGAAYGDRLSSLLVIHNRAGATEHAFTGSGALSLTDSNVILEGRMPRGSGSWLVTGRRTYYDLVAERFTDQDLPSFNDLQGKSVFRLGGGRTLSFFGLRSREATDASFDNPKEGAKGAVFTRTRNDVLAATFETPLGSRGVARTIASGYTNTDSVDFGGDFRDETRRSNAPGQTAFDTTNIAVTWDGTVRDLALRQELTLQTSSHHVLEAGGELHRLRTRVRFTIPGARNNTEANSSSLQGGAALPEDLDSSRDDTRVGAWLQDRVSISSRVSLDAGLRLDRSSVNDQTSVSPRFSGTVALTPSLRLRGALGLYTQSPGYEKLVQADYFVDLTAPGPLALQSERARHALLSLERDLPGGVLLRTAAYYKRFDRMIVGRLETPEETAARITEYDFPAALAANVPHDPFITTFPTNDARGHAYGFDVYVSRLARQAPTRLTGWASYTYGVATRDAYGRSFPFDYDRRHAVTAVANLRLTPKLTLSTTGRLASGFPRTPVLGLRVASAPD
ncbi:MAG: TonB-dependent receptor plug domain-containing protein, partial [bacterium]